MAQSNSNINRRSFLGHSLATAGAAGLITAAAADEPTTPPGGTAANAAASADAMPLGTIGNVRISRLLLGGNLIGGWLHGRDLKYLGSLFRHYATEDKILETLEIAEHHGINTVFETGADFIARYNRERGGRMQFIPHIQVSSGQNEVSLKEHIQKQVDSAPSLCTSGASRPTD